MSVKEYTKTEFRKKFGNTNKYLDVYVNYDYTKRQYIYEVRSIKNKPHENHETAKEILEDIYLLDSQN
jgi:hypothetical protein